MSNARLSSTDIVQMVNEVRGRTLDLVADLSDEQMIGPLLAIVNPLLWEIGHVAWFQELWVLRHLRKHKPIFEGGDTLYNSAEVAHDTRWELRLPSREKTLDYMRLVLNRVNETMSSKDPSEEEVYFHLLVTLHESMHNEAFTYTRQTLGYSPPRLNRAPGEKSPVQPQGGPLPGDVEPPGGTFMLGATGDIPFVFDNEKWAHQVSIQPFRIARAPITNAEFAAFVEEGGYRHRKWWSKSGWDWREKDGAEHPTYWQRESGGRWLQRRFNEWLPLIEHHPIIHVNWYEAEAYCNWAGRRLPTEAEWESAASGEPTRDRCEIAGRKRRFPWGDEPPTPDRANLDWSAGGCVDVGALPLGDSIFGCRQMIGNVWEWTATDFRPYPGFVVDPYKEYSQPWFENHKVLRGGCWTTRSYLIRNTWRNFYIPDRRDVWAGFRTCAK